MCVNRPGGKTMIAYDIPFDSLPCAIQHIAHEPLLGLRTSGRRMRCGGFQRWQPRWPAQGLGRQQDGRPLPQPAEHRARQHGPAYHRPRVVRYLRRESQRCASPWQRSLRWFPSHAPTIASTEACVPATPCCTATRVVSTVASATSSDRSTIPQPPPSIFSTEPCRRR